MTLMKAATTAAQGLIRRKYALGAAAMFAAVTIRQFWFLSPDAASALGGSYNVMSTMLITFIAAVLGLNLDRGGGEYGPIMRTKKD